MFMCVYEKRGKKRATFEAIRLSQDLPNELLLTLVFSSSSSLKFSKALIHEYRAKINTNYVLKRERERKKLRKKILNIKNWRSWVYAMLPLYKLQYY